MATDFRDLSSSSPFQILDDHSGLSKSDGQLFDHLGRNAAKQRTCASTPNFKIKDSTVGLEREDFSDELRSTGSSVNVNVSGSTDFTIGSSSKNYNCQKRKSIIDQSHFQIEQHLGEKTYVQTKTFKKAKEALKKNLVILKGNPGDGKTSMAKELMYGILQENEDAVPMIIYNDREWRTYVNGSRRHPVVLIDHDVFIKFFVNQTHLFSNIYATAKTRHAHVIISIRRYNYEDQKSKLQGHELFHIDNIIDISEYQLSQEESRQILMNHLKKGRLCNELEIESMDTSLIYQRESKLPIKLDNISQDICPMGFPKCCYLFANSKHLMQQDLHFFQNPTEWLATELFSLQNEKKVFGWVLISILLSGDNGLCMDQLRDEESKSTKIVSRAASYCNCQDTSLQTFKNALMILETTFLRYDENKNCFIFSNIAFRDALCLNIATYDSSLGLELCSWHVMKHYAKLEAVNTPCIRVLKSDYKVLAKRLLDALKNADHQEIIEHPSLRNEHFCEIFIAQIKNLRKDEKISLFTRYDSKHNSLIYSILDQGQTNYNLFDAVIGQIDEVLPAKNQKKERKKCLNLVCERNNYRSYMTLIKREDTKVHGNHLAVAAENNCTDIFNDLISYYLWTTEDLNNALRVASKETKKVLEKTLNYKLGSALSPGLFFPTFNGKRLTTPNAIV